MIRPAENASGDLRVLLQPPAWTFISSPGEDAPGFSREAPASPGSTQDRIFQFIVSHPGVHLREICRGLGLAMGDVQYHTRRLELEGRITSSRRGFYRFFYQARLFGERQRDVLSFLSLDTPREILLVLIGSPGKGQDEISKAVGVSQPTLSWHLKRLVELGIVEKAQTGRSASYQISSSDATDIRRFIMAYHPSAWGRWSSRLADIFISYSEGEGEESSR